MKIKAAVFDWGYTIHDHEKDVIYPDALKLLNYLKSKGIILVLISRAPDIEERFKEFKKFNLQNFFSEMDVVPRGSNKEFSTILNKIKITPQETLVIGDRIKSEILEGNKIGCITVWFRNGKFANEFAEVPQEKPAYTVISFKEIIPIVKSINFGA